MKLSKPAVIVVAVAALIGSGFAADAATTTSPVKLCSNAKSGVVEVPKAGTCAKGATAFYVASQGDVQALTSRADADDSSDAALAARVATLEAQVAELLPGSISVTTTQVVDGLFNINVVGTKIPAGTYVDVRGRTPDAYQSSILLAQSTFGADGKAQLSGVQCGFAPYQVKTSDGENQVIQNISAVPGC